MSSISAFQIRSAVLRNLAPASFPFTSQLTPILSTAMSGTVYAFLKGVLLAELQHLQQRWQDLFQAQFDVLLYDLTSTYIEGAGEGIGKAKHGYSRDQRFDCKQVVIALVITVEGLPLAMK